MKKLAMRQAMVLAGKKSIFIVLALMNCVSIDASNLKDSKKSKKAVSVRSSKSNKKIVSKTPEIRTVPRRTVVQPVAKPINQVQDNEIESDEYSKLVSQAPLKGHVEPSVDVNTQELPDGTVIQTKTTVQPVEEEGKVVTTVQTWTFYDIAKAAAITAGVVGLGAAAYYNQDAIKNGLNSGYQSANNWWKGSSGTSLDNQGASMDNQDTPMSQTTDFVSGSDQGVLSNSSDDVDVNPSQEQQAPNISDENLDNGLDQDLGMQDVSAMESDESGYSDTAKAAGAGLASLGAGFAAYKNPGVRQAVQKGLTQVGQKSSNILKNAPLMPKTASNSIATAEQTTRASAEQSKNLQAYWSRRDAADGIDRAEQLLKQQVASSNRIANAKSELVYDNSLANRVELHKALKQSGATPVASNQVNSGMAKLTQTQQNIAFEQSQAGAFHRAVAPRQDAVITENIANINNQVALG